MICCCAIMNNGVSATRTLSDPTRKITGEPARPQGRAFSFRGAIKNKIWQHNVYAVDVRVREKPVVRKQIYS